MTVDTEVNNIADETSSLLELYSKGFKKSDKTPTHLIFLIHGIGYKMFDKDKFKENIKVLSETSKSVLEEKFADSGMRLFYAPIEWAEEFHALTTVDGRMSKITLPTVPAMRVITNDCLSDVLYYFTDFHRQHLLDLLCRKINQIYQEFIEVYPDFNGSIGIISHSLGGVISYDLLSVKNQEAGTDDHIYKVAFPRTNYPKLDFEPKFLYTLGSPIGAVIVMRGLKYKDFCLSDDLTFMNIYNNYDPLAYRIEPLISEEYEELEAVPIEVFESNTSSYLPRFSALLPELPEAPQFIKTAKNLLVSFKNDSEISQENDSDLESSGYESSNEGSINSIEWSKESIHDFKPVNQNDTSTPSLCFSSATAVGLSAFKRGSVIERLYEFKTNGISSESGFNSQSNSRPSSIYQGAIETLFSYSNFKRTQPSPKTKSKSINKPRRPKLRQTITDKDIYHKSKNTEGYIDSKILNKEDSSESNTDLIKSKIKSKDDSFGDRKKKDKNLEPPSSMIRSKTWSYIDSIRNAYDEEQIMWLWGSMAFNIEQNKSKKKNEKKITQLDNDTTKTEVLNEKPLRSVSFDMFPSEEENEKSLKPRLIKNLTNKKRLSIESHDSLEDLDLTQYVNLPDPHGHTVSQPLEHQNQGNIANDILSQEKEALSNLDEDAHYPPDCCQDKSLLNLKRIDYCMQTKAISNISMEYFVGLGAHFSYWDNKDVANHILKSLNEVMIEKRKNEKETGPDT